MENTLFQVSIIASFVAGMVALFAPCCITFLLPAYLGNVFKEKEKVLFMTLIFGLGIFIVLMPAVLGVSIVSKMIFRYHDGIYIFGGIVMLIVALITFLGIKMPMPRISQKTQGKTDVLSIFTLGIFSGITSACCAPVLIGVMALTFLTPSFFGSLLVGSMYVLGMVTPLLLISVFLSGKMPKLIILKRPIGSLKIFKKEYVIILSNAIAGAIFFIAGTLTLVLNSEGKLSMAQSESVSKMIQNVGGYVNSQVGGNIALNVIFVGLVILFIYKISKKV
ncbi:MAG: cytochrome c biogenesis protein CcdA [Candidatus Daviesbacteria bacterium]|nr:cytochrome c biogenesis protein CcdA [Candidatus Daviesbacteria bacterium]